MRSNGRLRPLFLSGAAVLAAAVPVAACARAPEPAPSAADRAVTQPPVTTGVPAAPPPPPAPTTSPPAPPPPLDAGWAPPPAPDPAALAGRLTEAEAVIRSPGSAPPEVAHAAHLQQAAYRQLAAHPEWDAEVLARIPPELVGPVQANVAAGRELRQLVRRPRPELPAWRIVPPAPAEELHAHYREAEAASGVPWPYLAAIHLTETRMGRIRGTSSAGAQGPMQFLPSTWEAYGQGDINDDRDAILAAARYLAANGAPSDMGRALHRYNPTPRYVRAVTLYAEQMLADPRTFHGYYHWQVYFTTTLGDVLLPVGYEASERRPVTPADVPVAGAP